MGKSTGTIAMGIKAPIIRYGDDLEQILINSIEDAIKNDGIKLKDNDIIGITEAVVAKSERNYAMLTDVAEDIKSKYDNEIGIVFPITSRNRFANILKAIAMSVDKIYIQLSYPSDEVGNKLIDEESVINAGINPYQDILTEQEFYQKFSDYKHEYTGVDYIQLYKEVTDGKAEIILANDPTAILNYTKDILVADIHTREKTKQILTNAGAKTIYDLADIMNKPINGSGYNHDYGLLGSNLSSEDRLKLFPRDCNNFCEKISKTIAKKFGVKMHVLVYGDGAFKDPTSGIWELADPVVTPGFTNGLAGVPNEVKLKFLADNAQEGLTQDQLQAALKKEINRKSKTKNDTKASGTTPRKIVDLLGSLCDLTSGSGDKGTPFVLIQGYFDNYAKE